MMLSRTRLRLAAALALLAAFSPMTWAETFRFRYQAGQQYRIVSEVQQTVSVNDFVEYTANQLNRILVTVLKVEGERGWHTVDYQNSLELRTAGAPYQFDRSYTAEFWRDPQGVYAIDPRFFVPTVRNVPVFPDRDIRPGESWSGKGSEVHDLRQGFGIPDAFEFPIPVEYTYGGKAAWQGKEYDLIDIDYNIFHRPRKTWAKAIYPTQISGYSHQRMYWDNSAGRPVYYEEEYLIEMVLSSGVKYSFEGTADAHAEDIVPFDLGKAAEDVRQQVADLAIPGVNVRQDENGITLSIENIQFAPDSAELMPMEKTKLDKIGGILARYPDRDLLVTGHTAQAGYAEGRQKLSEDRAKSVGQYLIDHKVRPADSLMYRGMGDRQPVADNASDEGRARNRRVEITILTK
jgi:outer membrane protein OmpA-like peptidoglycan-associated protein